jgi:hypothetical protein
MSQKQILSTLPGFCEKWLLTRFVIRLIHGPHHEGGCHKNGHVVECERVSSGKDIVLFNMAIDPV